MPVSLLNPDWGLQESSPALLICKLSHLGLISLADEQAASFLQGQVTADVTSLDSDSWCWGAHCDPKGKMLASFRLFNAKSLLWLLMPKSTLAVDLPQLQKYAVFSKVTLKDECQDWQLYGVSGDNAESFITERFGAVSTDVVEFDDGIIIKDSGRYIIVSSPEFANALFADQAIYESSSWQAQEIILGYPNIAANHSGEYVPQMCNLDAIGGISFTKGCYMGQETVARMKYRGGNKRALYILSGTVSELMTKDNFIEIELESGYRKAGNVIEFAQRGEQVLLTAVLANDTEGTARFRIAGDLSSQLMIKPLPYDLTDEE
ncbi:tRNA-modifying protein YgfZ [Parashewanella spongiae]|uniref:tRNA-modifying protein YgfZ n=1 Tax=Parashewanella spongiae TaxID=342950 RepID=A0A3A6UMB8_9GAMM|nr:tRNA-modifying protein YgfZ [Parashewanella spongiae]MCL1077123.1 tRNA-modifying protein YgfZ [Parashewanella spongiae]RJY18854.1 tRNA-modifying protein YgfZ [Parashewanella spongiae]